MKQYACMCCVYRYITIPIGECNREDIRDLVSLLNQWIISEDEAIR